MAEIPSEPVTQYETICRATESLRNFSSNRELGMSPDLHSHTNSPNSTLGHGVHCRPSPPPYVRPKFKPELWQEEPENGNKTWYCWENKVEKFKLVQKMVLIL